MQISDGDIEWIVREVMRRLSLMGAENAGACTTATQDEWSITANVVGLAELECGLAARLQDSKDLPAPRGKLGTLATIKAQLKGLTQITVPCRSVVTPAVRDLLAEENIALSQATAREGKAPAEP